MVLGIVLHAALPFVSGLEEFWPSDPESSSAISIIFQFIHLWRMPLFFILAGFFAKLLIERKTWKKWLTNRLVRVGIPILIFSPVMMITLPWIYMYGWKNEINITFSLEGYPHHLWFLWHLIIFVFVSCAIRPLNIFIKNTHFFEFLNKIVFMHKFPMVLILLVSFFIVFSGGELILNPFATSLYFLLGYSIYKDVNFLNFLVFNWKKYMIIGLIVSCFFLIFENLLYFDFQYKLPPQELDQLQDLIWLINQPIKVTGAIFISFGLIGLFESQINQFNPIGRFLSDSAYWMYLIHLPIVNLISFYMFQFPLLPEIKFLISIFSTLFLTLITYKVFVRSTYLGFLLNGKIYPFMKIW